jgi:hypothetical protein
MPRYKAIEELPLTGNGPQFPAVPHWIKRLSAMPTAAKTSTARWRFNDTVTSMTRFLISSIKTASRQKHSQNAIFKTH